MCGQCVTWRGKMCEERKGKEVAFSDASASEDLFDIITIVK